LVGEAKARGVGAERPDQLFIDNLDDLLGRREGGQNLLAEGLLFDRLDELFNDLKVDVSLKQRNANLAESGFHVFGSEFSFAAQVLENSLQFIG
jgi:hypothetical protein